jgi:NADPH:quinone reductase-like Zn-dependent oxidoreductase
MKAIYIEGQGGLDVLKYGNIPDPIAGAGEVVVDIYAASINGADAKRRQGSNLVPTIKTFPHILGRDFSGVVCTVGEGVDEFNVGDEVFAVLKLGDEGTYAEKVVIEAAILIHKPKSLSHVQATSLALIGLTAITSLENTLQLKSDEKILIQGGAGGVAGYAVQLAKHIGASVVTTASADNHEYVRGLGADQVIDYKAQNFTEVVSGCDAVFDTVGGDVTVRSFAVLKPGGRLASIASGKQAPQSPRDDVQSLRPNAKRDRRYLERIIELFENGAVQLPEITCFPLTEVVEAHRISQGRHLRGKLVLEVR